MILSEKIMIQEILTNDKNDFLLWIFLDEMLVFKC